jgi:hypothetical protein
LLVLAFVTAGTTSAVATVDGQAITLTTFRVWLSDAAVSAHASDSKVPAFVPDAPNYARCIAFERKATAKKGSKAASVATLRADCSAINVTLAGEVMQFLVSAQWFLDEGEREHVTVTAAQVQRALHSSFPKTAGLTQFLNTNGLNRSNLEFEARAALVAEKLSAEHSGPKPTISSAQISAYYKADRSEVGDATLAQATPTIREVLTAEAEAPTFDAWLSKVQGYFRPRTTCAQGYRIAYYCVGGS